MKKAILSLAIATIILSLGISADAVPPITIDQSNLLQTGWGWTAMSWDISQTFKPDMPVLAGVDIDILTANPSLGDATIKAELRKSGQIVASSSRLIPVGYSGLLHFEFVNEVPVTIGDTYELHIPGSKDTFGWKYSGNSYPNGNRKLGTNQQINNDCLFQTYGRPSPLTANGQMNLGVYSLCQYENNWKPYICLQQAFDPYYDFWNTMSGGSGAPFADTIYSQRFQNSAVTLKRAIPVTGGAEKSWDDFHLVFFYGHNNTIVPPHPHEWFQWFNYENGLWASHGGWLDQIGWGHTTNYDYYAVRPINNADQYPGAVTYLYPEYTSTLLGKGYDYGGGVNWREHWNDQTHVNIYGRLGDRNLKWLILHGCQAVITSNMDGSYNPLAFKIFSGIHGDFHIALGHYKSYYTSQLVKPLAEFANDLLAGVPIQNAYFDFDPDHNTSAIAAEKWSPSGTVDWPNSTMLKDKWNGALSDNVGTNTFSMKWIVPSGGQAQQEEKMMATDSLNARKVNIKSIEARQLLKSDSIFCRQKNTSFIPKGEIAVVKLEKIDDNDSKRVIRELIQKFVPATSITSEVESIGGIYLSRNNSSSTWVHRASGSYKYTETKQDMPTRPMTVIDFYRAIQNALDYVAKRRLVTLVPGEEMDILFVSAVKSAVAASEASKPAQEFISDYYVGFGRRFNGIPIVGSKLVLRLNGNGNVVMVNKNWRQIERASGVMKETVPKSVINPKTLPELIVNDPIFQSLYHAAARGQRLNPKDIEIVETECGYMEAPMNYVQNSLRPGCNVSFMIGKKRGEILPQLVFPIEQAGSMEKLWGVEYQAKN